MSRRLKNVKIKWSAAFAYAIGLITTDGNLSKTGRHINLTSKDFENISNFKKCLGLKNKIGKKARDGSKDKKYFVIQFGDINFYNFLLSIGIMQRKSKLLKYVMIPKKYFSDFLRGCMDGDGSITLANHPESKHKQLRLRFATASLDFALWLMAMIKKQAKCKGGWIYSAKGKVVHSLSYGKEDSTKIIKFMYYNGVKYYLSRKYKKIEKLMGK